MIKTDQAFLNLHLVSTKNVYQEKNSLLTHTKQTLQTVKPIHILFFIKKNMLFTWTYNVLEGIQTPEALY